MLMQGSTYASTTTHPVTGTQVGVLPGETVAQAIERYNTQVLGYNPIFAPSPLYYQSATAPGWCGCSCTGGGAKSSGPPPMPFEPPAEPTDWGDPLSSPSFDIISRGWNQPIGTIVY